MLVVPARLVERTQRELGSAGGAWIEALPSTVGDALHRWGLTWDGVLPLGKEPSLVLAVITEQGTPAVLKASFPDDRCWRKALALTLWRGDGAAPVEARSSRAWFPASQ